MARTALSHNDVKSFPEQTSRRLNAKCHGKLEIRDDELLFIHRTASDYLKTSEMAEYIHARSDKGLNTYLSMLKACVACLKMGVEGTAQVYL